MTIPKTLVHTKMHHYTHDRESNGTLYSMGKYIWPRDLKNASLWYLNLLKRIGKGASLNEIIFLIETDQLTAPKASRRSVQSSLYKLQRAGLVSKSGSYNHAQYTLTSEGEERLRILTFRNQPIKKQVWDGRWRLVLFDIPEVKKESRYHIRRLLKELGFHRLQLSAWIHPLPLLKQFEEIQHAYGIERDLLLLDIADYVPPADILKHFAHLDLKIIIAPTRSRS